MEPEIGLLDVVREAIRLSGVMHVRCSDNGDMIRIRRRRHNIFLGKVGFGVQEIASSAGGCITGQQPVWHTGFTPIEGGICLDFGSPDSIESLAAFFRRIFE